MQNLTELELAHFPWEDPAFAEAPDPYFAAARERHPWAGRCNAGYVVHEYTAARDLLLMGSDHMRTSFDSFIDYMGARGTPWGRFEEEQMIALEGAPHQRLRDLFAPRFTPREADRLRNLMHDTIADLLDEWAPAGEMDFADFASHFPISVLCKMLGAPTSVIPHIKDWLETLGLAFSLDPRIRPAVDEAFVNSDNFVRELVKERRARGPGAGPPDLLDVMIECSDEGGMTERQLADMLVFLFVAGYDTSKNVLTFMMHLLIDRPDIYRRCATDADYCRKTVEEVLRIFSPATIFREARQDVVYRDVLIPKGSLLFFPLSMLGRDPGAFPDPDTLDPERAVVGEKRHLAFGRGPHICLGQYIARAQLQEGLRLIAQRIREPRRVGDIGWRPFAGLWGLTTLPIAFEPAPADTAVAA
jgi:cytochrome P450